MDYPPEILPNPTYKIIDCDLSSYFIIRLTETDNIADIINPDTDEIYLKFICSPEERIDDLSFSLFGTYNARHINLSFTATGKEKYMFYCDPNETVDVPIYDSDFTNGGKRSYWSIPIGLVNNAPFDYSRSNEPFTAICKVKHTPMKWNYWHFSLRWQTDLGPLENLDAKQRKNVARRIGHSARVILSHHAKLISPVGVDSTLPETCYRNN